MRAEREEDEFDRPRPARKQPERRLAHEIALGIIFGGCVLMTIADVKGWIEAKVLAEEIRITLGR